MVAMKNAASLHDVVVLAVQAGTSRRPRGDHRSVFELLLLNREGSRGFESASLRQPVWHVSLHSGEAMKSARGARFTRGGGPGECQRSRLTAKIGQNSLFAILSCPSANRPTILWGRASS